MGTGMDMDQETLILIRTHGTRIHQPTGFPIPMSNTTNASFYFPKRVTINLPKIVSCGDEQAPRLAPEKRDFTATYTLGATMQQITYYYKSRLVGWSFSVYVGSVGVSVSVAVAVAL